ncbi:MAG: hypothetical protein ACPGYY_08335 [Bacteroidia bacterium]
MLAFIFIVPFYLIFTDIIKPPNDGWLLEENALTIIRRKWVFDTQKITLPFDTISKVVVSQHTYIFYTTNNEKIYLSGIPYAIEYICRVLKVRGKKVLFDTRDHEAEMYINGEIDTYPMKLDPNQ